MKYEIKLLIHFQTSTVQPLRFWDLSRPQYVSNLIPWQHILKRKRFDILTKLSSLAAPEVFKMTTLGAATDDNFVKMTTFSFHPTGDSWADMFLGYSLGPDWPFSLMTGLMAITATLPQIAPPVAPVQWVQQNAVTSPPPLPALQSNRSTKWQAILGVVAVLIPHSVKEPR